MAIKSQVYCRHTMWHLEFFNSLGLSSLWRQTDDYVLVFVELACSRGSSQPSIYLTIYSNSYVLNNYCLYVYYAPPPPHTNME